jgi:hypothetical protein
MADKDRKRLTDALYKALHANRYGPALDYA